MAISLYVAKETRRHEKRVALVPAVVAKLQKLGIEPCVEPGAGLLARIPDNDFTQAGAAVAPAPAETRLFFRVQPPSLHAARALRRAMRRIRARVVAARRETRGTASGCLRVPPH